MACGAESYQENAAVLGAEVSGMGLGSGGFLKKQMIWKQRYDDVRQQSLQRKGLSLRCPETHRKLTAAGGLRSGAQRSGDCSRKLGPDGTGSGSSGKGV